MAEEKKAMAEFGSSDSGASLGDILTAQVMADDANNGGRQRANSRAAANGAANGTAHGRDEAPRLYRLNSNQSASSIFEDVEMAQDELYAGPMAESLPTSVSAFAHRQARADSTTRTKQKICGDECAAVAACPRRTTSR